MTYLPWSNKRWCERHRTRIVKAISDHDKNLESNSERINFLCSFNDDQSEELHTYDNISRSVEKDNNDPDVWKFKYITAHERPFSSNHSNYKEFPYNIMIQ